MATQHLDKEVIKAQIGFNLWRWYKNDFLGVDREMRWSYLPPLMVYFAAGVSGFTGIIESFFVVNSLFQITSPQGGRHSISQFCSYPEKVTPINNNLIFAKNRLL
jgi:hypothetical protein